MQPVIQNADVARFKRNAIVCFLLDAGPYDLNKLALMNFTKADREQFAQLIGYSVSGFGDLSYVSNKAYYAARAQAEKLVANRKSKIANRKS